MILLIIVLINVLAKFVINFLINCPIYFFATFILNFPIQMLMDFLLNFTQGRQSARCNDTTAARLAEVGRRWCHCLYAREAGGWQGGRDAGKEDTERGEGRESVVWLLFFFTPKLPWHIGSDTTAARPPRGGRRWCHCDAPTGGFGYMQDICF